MPKISYYVATFPSTSVKCPLATLSGHILGKIDRIFEILHNDESPEKSAFGMLLDMMQNNESIFAFGVSDINSCASTSSQEKLNQSPSKGVSSSCLTQKLPFVDRTNENLAPKSLETKSTLVDSQKSVDLCEKLEVLGSSVEDEKMEVDATKDAEIKVIPKDENKASEESKEDINKLIKRNSAGITSVSVIRQAESIVVEIDVDIESVCKCDAGTPEKPKQESSPSKKITSPGEHEIKIKSPSESPSKSKELEDTRPISSESPLNVDFSDPNILDFLSERLVSILSSRKTCMEQIHNYFKKVLRDVTDFSNSIGNIQFVVENLPMAKEQYLTDDLLELRDVLMHKASEMFERAESLLISIKKDIDAIEDCLTKRDIFEEEHVPSLSSRGESKLTITDLKKIESELKEIFTAADEWIIFKVDWRMMLSNSSLDFKLLVNYFVQFLIITEILRPNLPDSS